MPSSYPTYLFSTALSAGYTLVVTFVVGLVMGSFLNCWAWRLTHGESVMHGHSHCVTCGHELRARDLVPLASWLSTRGRCRYCGERVSVRYPLTELTCAVVFTAIVWRYARTLTLTDLADPNLTHTLWGMSGMKLLEAVELMAFSGILLVLTLTDLDRRIIPNGCIVAAIVVRAAYIVACGAYYGWDRAGELAVFSLLGAVPLTVGLVVLVVIMDHVLGRPSMGGGDLKLFFVAGLYFGWQQMVFTVLLSCVLGIVLGTAMQRRGGGDLAEEAAALDSEDTAENTITAEQDAPAPAAAFDVTAPKNPASASAPRGSSPFPFGPAIAVACVVTMLAGAQVVSAYLGLFGL